MERADKNIDELLETLHGTFHRIRQAGIDEEFFDVIAGFEALSKRKNLPGRPWNFRRKIVTGAGDWIILKGIAPEIKNKPGQGYTPWRTPLAGLCLANE